MDDIRYGYKVLTHHYCSPIHGGAPLWDSQSLPSELPQVALDTSAAECAARQGTGRWRERWRNVAIRPEVKHQVTRLAFLDDIAECELIRRLVEAEVTRRAALTEHIARETPP